MRAVVLACIACTGCDALFHLDHVPLPGDGAGVSDGPRGEPGDQPNLVFVTSQKIVPASLGGAAAADALCTSLAAQAGHPGRYVAWLGTSTASATARIGATARGWVRADGKPFADTLVDIVQGTVWYPLRLTESGTDLAATDNDVVVVTGTNPDGSSALDTCGDYTKATIPGVISGLADDAPFGWNANMGAACTDSVQLYCFGVDHVAAVSVVPESTRIAFVTNGDQLLQGGLGTAAFDQECAAEARAAQLPGTFLAAVATTTTPALARFSTGGPWVRRDGVTAIDSNGKLTAPIDLDAGGQVQASNVVWNGSTSLLTKAPGNAASCFDWTVSDGTQGLSGNASRSSSDGIGGLGNSCVNAMRVYCLQN